MDIWIAIDPRNADRMVAAIHEFGFASPNLSPELFLRTGSIVRIGIAPIRIEVLTTISGVKFDDCFAERVTANLDGVAVNLISLRHLKINKEASGRHKDLDDLENLP